jgi:hypothetical protein
MSGRTVEVADRYTLRLVPKDSGGYWVRRKFTGRTLGTVTQVRSKWNWETWPSAYRGDGRKGSERDGYLSDIVPAGLLRSGRETTQQAACEALVAHLVANQAPALGFGPHPDVSREKVTAR